MNSGHWKKRELDGHDGELKILGRMQSSYPKVALILESG